MGPHRKAATYSPTWCGSTIGANGLNFPVRNGKGWAPSPWPPRFYPELVSGPPCPKVIRCRKGISSNLYDICWDGPLARPKKESTKYCFYKEPREGGAQAYGQLVPLGCMHRCTSTYGLSTWSSPTAL